MKTGLPKEWHYNIQSLRMEKTVEVRNENDELIGYNEHCAIVPDDIIALISRERAEAVKGYLAVLMDLTYMPLEAGTKLRVKDVEYEVLVSYAKEYLKTKEEV